MHLRRILPIIHSGQFGASGVVPSGTDPDPDPPPPDPDPDPSGIQPVSTWVGKYSLQRDYDTNWNLATSGNADKMYLDISQTVSGNRQMWKATGDTRFLDRALLYIDAVISTAKVSNATNFPRSQYKDGYLGWLTHGEIGGDDWDGLENCLAEMYMWRYVALLLDDMYGMTGTYGTRRDAILAFTEKNIWEKWYSRGPNNTLYRSVIHICCHSAITAMVLKRIAKSSTIRSQATTVLTNIDSAGMSAFAGGNIRNQITSHVNPADSGAMWWRSYWRPSDSPGGTSGPDYIHGGDSSHASAVCTYLVEAIARGYGGWTTSIIPKLVRMVAVIWPSGSTYHDRLDGTVDTAYNWRGVINDGFISIGRYSNPFQKRIENFPVAQNAALWGGLALNARYLINGKPAAGYGS